MKSQNPAHTSNLLPRSYKRRWTPSLQKSSRRRNNFHTEAAATPNNSGLEENNSDLEENELRSEENELRSKVNEFSSGVNAFRSAVNEWIRAPHGIEIINLGRLPERGVRFHLALADRVRNTGPVKDKPVIQTALSFAQIGSLKM